MKSPLKYHGGKSNLASRIIDLLPDRDHVNLLKSLRDMDGKFLLSGYRNDTYDSFAHHLGWRRVDFEAKLSSSSAKTKSTKIESVWMNY